MYENCTVVQSDKKETMDRVRGVCKTKFLPSSEQDIWSTYEETAGRVRGMCMKIVPSSNQIF